MPLPDLPAAPAANGDAPRYFEATTMLFKQQGPLMDRTTDTLKAVGGRFGMNEQAVEACVRDQALLDKLTADQRLALDELQVDRDVHLFAHQDSAGFERGIPGQPKVLAVDLRRRRQTDPRIAPRILLRR